MSAVTSTIPWHRPVTADEFAGLDVADDGQRYELLDGVLVVSPSPTVAHQRTSVQLAAALVAAAPADVEVFTAPLDVRLSDDTVVQPDIVVVRARDAVGSQLAGVPLLVVEILSDSTRGNDLLLKRARYARAGIACYWIVEPVSGEFTLLRLAGADGYAVEGQGVLDVTGVAVERPFPVVLSRRGPASG